MPNWLFPAVTASLISTILMTLVYWYLYSQEKLAYLRIWTFGWVIYTLRFVLMLFIISGFDSPALLIGNQMAAFVSGFFILWGTYSFLYRPIPTSWVYLTIAGSIWIAAGVLMDFSFLTLTLPVFLALGIAMIWTGIVFIKADGLDPVIRNIMGYTFILWGLHKLDYPFLKPIAWFAPWGYMIGAILALGVAVGMILVYFKRNKSELNNMHEDMRLYMFALDNTDDSVFLITPSGQFKYVNKSACDKLGYTAEDLLNMGTPDLDPDFQQKVWDAHWLELRKQKTLRFETIHRDKNGKDTAMEVLANHVTYGGEEYNLAFARDISQRLANRKELNESRERLNLIIQRMPTVCIVWDTDFRVTLWNPKAEEIFGYSSEEAMGKKPYDIILDSSTAPAIEKIWERLITGDTMAHSINENITKDGKTITCEWHNTPLMKDGKSIGVIAMTQDITARQEAEQKITASLAEKEVLLKEIHHRVKNNMAIITSLLRMQSEFVREEEYKGMFNESISRISSMALVHEKLYQSDDFSHIDIKDYINSLMSSVVRTFGGITNSNVSIDVDNIPLNIDMLIPCGLILNELITNSFKHAFKATEAPLIIVKLKDAGNSTSLLEVSDNGQGLRDDFDMSQADGLGLKLVQALTSQLGGTLEVSSDNGSSFKISFPITPEVQS